MHLLFQISKPATVDGERNYILGIQIKLLEYFFCFPISETQFVTVLDLLMLLIVVNAPNVGYISFHSHSEKKSENVRYGTIPTLSSTPAGTTIGLKLRECGQIGVTTIAGTLGCIMEAPAATA